MHICYLDEAGCTGAIPSANSAIQPVFVLGGLIVEESQIKAMTADLIHLKQRFFPGLLPAATLYHDWMCAEIKGSDIRRQARSNNRNDRRHAHMLVGRALDILENSGAKYVARAYVKPIGGIFNGSSVYTSTVQSICSSFQRFLEEADSTGIVIADSRNKGKNSNVSHSVFTQRHSAAGDPYPKLVEVPTFGHSDNHAGLQMMDCVCSALFFPMVAQACCAKHLTDHTHVSVHYESLSKRFGERLRNLQYRYQDEDGRWRGGLTLIDPLNKLNAKSVLG